MKKILVTGATGFIGNYVVSELIRTGHRVIASSASAVNAGNKQWFQNVEYIQFDFAGFDNAKNYFEFFQSPDLMIHLAWEGLPNYTANFHLDVNLARHQSLLKNLIANGLKDLTVTGTCLEYGFQEGKLDESMPAKPSNPYAIAKNNLRESLEEFRNDHPFNFKWVRLFYMYGKGQNPNSLLSQLDKALANEDQVFNMSGGEQLRDYLPVETVAKYIVAIALQQKVTGIINCSSGAPVRIKDFVEEYLKNKKKQIKLNFGHYPYTTYEPMAFWGDNNKLKTILND
jgi:nucleoside-diphosphate-sugar epimerase